MNESDNVSVNENENENENESESENESENGDEQYYKIKQLNTISKRLTKQNHLKSK